MTAREKINKLMTLLTVKQVVDAGEEYIEAAGLNPWCVNEGSSDDDLAIERWKRESLLDEISDVQSTYIAVEWYNEVGLVKKENKQLLFYLTAGTKYANILVDHAKITISDLDFGFEDPTWDDVVPLLERLRLL